MERVANQKTSKESWIPFQRDIIHRLEEGGISLGSFQLYCYARLSCDVNGRCAINLSTITKEIFVGKKKNTVYKYLKSLKDQKLLFYEDKIGSNKPYVIYFPDFFPGKGKRTSIDHLFNGSSSEQKTNVLRNESEVDAELKFKSQRSQGAKYTLTESRKSIGNFDKTRGYNTNNNTNIKKIDIKESCKVDKFNPSDNDEYLCLEIAKAIGEESVSFLLSHKRRGHMWAIEVAYGRYREQDKSDVKNLAAYFNKILQNVFVEKHGRDKNAYS